MPGLFRTRLERLEPYIPDEVEQDLLKQSGRTPEVEIKIVSNQGVLKWFVEENSRESKEIVKLGLLCLKLVFVSAECLWSKTTFSSGIHIGPFLSPFSKKLNVASGELKIISDEKGNLRFHVSYSRHEQERLARLLPLLGRPYGGLPLQGFQ